MPVTISVIIPVGESHHHLLPNAVKSVEIQDLNDVEIIVINDSTTTHPLATFNRTEDDAYGPGKARNIGTELSSGECLVYLDADDMLIPGSLRMLWEAYKETGCIVYGNVIRSDTGLHITPEPYYGNNPGISLTVARRPITCLYPRSVILAVGGWDEDMLWEDVELEIRTRVEGHCGAKINYPVYYYNMGAGERRAIVEGDDKEKETVRSILYNRYKKYYEGEELMGCSTCGSKSTVVVPVATNHVREVQNTNVNALLSMGYELELEYIHPDPSVKTYPGPVSNKSYRFGNSQARHKIKRVGNGADEVDPRDAQIFITQRSRTRGEDYHRFKLNVKEPRVIIEPPKADMEEIGAEVVEFSYVNEEVGTPEYEEQQELFMDLLRERRKTKVKPVSSFSIRAMEESIENGADLDDISIWLEQEKDSPNPRKGMISLLEGVLG